MRAVLAAFLLSASVISLSAEPLPRLLPGSKAPAYKVAETIKGEQVTSLGKGIYVVEFWATWCAPCRITIPHLTKLQQQVGDKATIIGVSAKEQDIEGATVAEQVREYVDELGGEMGYTVSRDTGSNHMANAWLDAAGETAIPTAFLVKDGTVQWIGHPMRLDQPLMEVIEGTFDAPAFRERYISALLEERRIEAAKAEAEAAKEAGDTTRLREIAAEEPGAREAALVALMQLAKERGEAAARIEARKAILTYGDEGAEAAARFSSLLSMGDDLALSIAVAKIVRTETSQPMALYSAAFAANRAGDPELAKAMYLEALKGIEKHPDYEVLRPIIQGQLDLLSGESLRRP